MDGERKSCTKRILSAIEYGKLPNDETERRLCVLVEAEVNKTDSEVDMELIRACQSLMWQLHTHGDNLYDSHYEENKDRINQRIRRSALISNTVISVGKMMVAAAAVILLFVGVRFSWFEHSDTPDGQQHVITGQEITVEMVQAAIAENAGKGTFETTNLQEVREIIGFDPHIPETVADEWHVSACVVRFARQLIQVSVKYEKGSFEDSYISYVVGYYNDVGDAYITFEQSNSGETTSIHKTDVYISNNIDSQVASWNRDNIVYELNARIDEPEFMSVLKKIIVGE